MTYLNVGKSISFCVSVYAHFLSSLSGLELNQGGEAVDHFVVSFVLLTSYRAEKWDVCDYYNRHMGKGKSMFSVH